MVLSLSLSLTHTHTHTHTRAGKEPMSATLPIRPGYPNLRTLDSLFSEGPVSFAKLAAEASRRTEEIPYQFDFGVRMDDPDLYISPEDRKKIENFLWSRTRTHKREYSRNLEPFLLRKQQSDKQKKPKSKKPAEKVEAAKAIAPSTAVNQANPQPKPKSKTRARSKNKRADKPATTENPTKPETSPPAVDACDSSSASADSKTKSRKTARDKFRRCENCDQDILERIQLCSGCKKVAYCNIRCQKSHWKQHKKTCSYVQKASEAIVHHCESCSKELAEHVLMCAGCRKVAYCNTECQRSHWKQHKPNCSYRQKKDTDQKA